MGLRADIQTDIAAAFNGDLADAVQSLTLKHITNNTFNTTTGVATVTYTDYTSRGVFDSLIEKELLQTPLGLVDTKVIILQNEVTVVPELNDEIVDARGNVFRVIKFGEDPAKCIYELGCRRST